MKGKNNGHLEEDEDLEISKKKQLKAENNQFENPTQVKKESEQLNLKSDKGFFLQSGFGPNAKFSKKINDFKADSESQVNDNNKNRAKETEERLNHFSLNLSSSIRFINADVLRKSPRTNSSLWNTKVEDIFHTSFQKLN